MPAQMTINIRGLLKAFFAVSTLGWINSLYTLWHRQNLLYGTNVGKSFCNISDSVNCDLVAMAPESAFLFGYPTSALGLSFYCLGFFVAWALYSESSPSRARAQARILFWIALIGLVPTFYLAMVSLFKIKSLCLMCLAGYVLNLTLLVLAFLMLRRTPADSKFPAVNAVPKTALILIAVSAALHFPLPWIFKSVASQGVDAQLIGHYLYKHQNSQKFRFRLEGSATLGSLDAPVQVVEFADFQCPACAMADEVVPAVIESFSPRVSFTFKNFPLDRSCNEAVEGNIHLQACDAALAGICVHKIKGAEDFFKFKKKVFQNYKSLSLGFLENSAEEHGISPGDLRNCMQAPDTREELRRQTLEGKAAGLQGTPSIYVNGKILEGGTSPIVLRKVINDYLKQSGK